jgi:hypothetical protein
MRTVVTDDWLLVAGGLGCKKSGGKNTQANAVLSGSLQQTIFVSNSAVVR